MAYILVGSCQNLGSEWVNILFMLFTVRESILTDSTGFPAFRQGPTCCYYVRLKQRYLCRAHPSALPDLVVTDFVEEKSAMNFQNLGTWGVVMIGGDREVSCEFSGRCHRFEV